jgi:hypothetical protein
MLKFSRYQVEGAKSILSNVPMSKLNVVRNFYKALGVSTRIRFRGPRQTLLDTIRHRDSTMRRSECLKDNGYTFSVYLR